RTNPSHGPNSAKTARSEFAPRALSGRAHRRVEECRGPGPRGYALRLFFFACSRSAARRSRRVVARVPLPLELCSAAAPCDSTPPPSAGPEYVIGAWPPELLSPLPCSAGGVDCSSPLAWGCSGTARACRPDCLPPFFWACLPEFFAGLWPLLCTA